jgi:hypothetical protein
MAVRQIPQYYVYEHWRLDKDECFYVGKGKGRRAYEKSKRGSHWENIVRKLERIGSAYEIRMVKTGLTEKEAFALEKERIAFWRDRVDLANKTDGGDGVSGLKHTAKTKAKMRAAKVGKPGKSGTTGMKFSDATKAKMRAAKLGKKPNNFGKKVSPDKLAKYSERMKEVWKDPAHREKAIRSGDQIGKETRQKLSLAATAQWKDPEKRPNRNKDK